MYYKWRSYMHGSPKMSSTADIMFCHFGLFFALLPPNSLKNENIKKWKKHLEKSPVYTSVPKILIIGYTVHEILHVMDVEIWHVTDAAVIFHFRLFLPFYPLAAQKIKISKNEKKKLEKSSFYKPVTKIMIRWCTVPELWCKTDRQTDRQIEKVT